MKTPLAKRDNYLPFGAPDFTEREMEAVCRVMRSGWIGMGPETLEFERELARYVGARHVVTVNSCTSALFLSLLAADVQKGDEVIVPSLTWCSTANVILQLGARPVFCDVSRETFCITPEAVTPLVNARTKAVMVVHFGGLAADVAHLRRHLPSQVRIIEDAAHALGTRYPDGTMVGSSGNLTCFSFYANKNLSTADGGAIALDDDDCAERLRQLRTHGMSSHAWARYVNPAVLTPAGLEELGYKMNYTDLQAAIGRVQLARLDEMSAHRRALAQRYHQQLHSALPGLALQAGWLGPDHARHLLAGLFDPEMTGMCRDDLLIALRDRNIGASIHYPPLHTMPLYSQYFRALPETEWLASRILTLPISARMTLDDVDEVCAHLIDILEGHRP